MTKNVYWSFCIFNILNNYCSLKVIGLYFYFSVKLNNKKERKKLRPQLINYILKYTWSCSTRVTSNGNWHAPNLTVPDSSICPIADQTLLLCFYSLCIRGLNTAKYARKKITILMRAKWCIQVPSCNTSPSMSINRFFFFFLIELKYVGCKLITLRTFGTLPCGFSENPPKNQALFKSYKPN